MTMMEIALIVSAVTVLASGTMRWSTAGYIHEMYRVPAHKMYRLFNVLFWFFTFVWILMLAAYGTTLAVAL